MRSIVGYRLRIVVGRGLHKRINLCLLSIVVTLICTTTEVSAQGCPADIMLNGKMLMKELRFIDAVSTFKLLILLYPASEESDEAQYLIVMSYREMGDRQRAIQWLSKARENIRIYLNRYPKGKYKDLLKEESAAVEKIEAQLTGVSKNIFIAFTAIAISSVLILGLVIGL